MNPAPTNGYIEIRKNRDGQDRAYIAGTRVRVQDVAALAEFHAKSADEIVTALPHLSLAQVHASLAYYFDHRPAIVEEMRQDDRFIETMKAKTGPGPLGRILAEADNPRDSLSS